jgi:hypothetical protein
VKARALMRCFLPVISQQMQYRVSLGEESDTLLLTLSMSLMKGRYLVLAVMLWAVAGSPNMMHR